MSKEQKVPKPEEYGTLGISCGYKEEARNVTYEHNAFPSPDGKHRWQYNCYNPDTGNSSGTKYTEWINN